MNEREQQNADLAGMAEAEKRWAGSGAMYPAEIEQQYRAIQARPIGDIKPAEMPYREKRETVFTVAEKKIIAGGSIVAVVTSICYSIVQVAATGAFNTLFGWIIGGGAVVFLLSGMELKSSRKPTGASAGGETHNHYHYYYQNNNFGGSGGANQSTSK